jgi:hypothetical protein
VVRHLCTAPFFNRDRLRCGDIIAGTWVVETPRTKLDAALSLGKAGEGISTVTGAHYRFSDEDLAIYGEYELKVLEQICATITRRRLPK